MEKREKDWLPYCEHVGCKKRVDNKTGYCLEHRKKTCEVCSIEFSSGLATKRCANHRLKTKLKNTTKANDEVMHGS